MRSKRRNHDDDIELNFIPLIDVLLVVIIFLMVTTTFAKLSEVKINLPIAEKNQVNEETAPIRVEITEDGHYFINNEPLVSTEIESIANVLRELAQDKQDTQVIISADANARHQSIINLMEAARKAMLSKIAFATKSNNE
ncbi:MAG: biopolymer transporter ExbD [Porticoccus sp.]|jgi:biopolymer transport protein ExbD|uniref:ExbD/TolR family protein n=1 Tax=Porticoccus sp. Uisw_050_02 TaxID=3230978 RepID=UPI0030B2E70A|tara:strand:- start:2008 stop:2427 length:420 start_codon:yes stop_codon:yes gene_type:complete